MRSKPSLEALLLGGVMKGVSELESRAMFFGGAT